MHKPDQFLSSLDKLDLQGVLMLLTVLSNKALQLSLLEKPPSPIIKDKPSIVL